jgi:hypothetical protein
MCGALATTFWRLAMHIRSVLPLALLCLTGVAGATTVVGGATLQDTATVINGTVNPTTLLSYVGGGNGGTGWADGSTYGSDGFTASQAMDAIDHHWLQFDPAIFMMSSTAINAVIAIPAIDHGWTQGNTGGEFYESFEFRILGCTAASITACSEEGKITKVWTQGVDDSSAAKNADDWTTEWTFGDSYTYFAIVSGDRLVGGGVPGYSAGEGEIDALAVAPAIPEPSTYALMLLGLGGIGWVSRRQARPGAPKP